MPAFFKLHLSPSPVVLAVAGELDLLGRDQLRWRLAEVEDAAGDEVHLDVSLVTFVDASCLRVLDDARQRFAARSVRLRVVAASTSFRLVTTLADYRELGVVEPAASPRPVVATRERRAP